MRRLVIICLLVLSGIALLGQRYVTEPMYKLKVNFEGVSTTPDWPLPTRLLYLLIPEDYNNQRFGLALSAGNEGCENRTPTVPAGPCEIDFTEIAYTGSEKHYRLRGKLRLELPRTKHEQTLRISTKDCPNVAGVIATEKDLQQNEAMSPSELAATATGAFYSADVSEEIEIPFNEGRTTIYLVYKLPEHWAYLPFGIHREP